MQDNGAINNPHDLFFKSFLRNKSTAIQLCENYVPDHILKYINISSIQAMPVSFVDEKLRNREADMLYQVELDSEIGYLYFLIEHQSTPDKKMPLRCARYMTLIQERHMSEHKTSKVPYVYPIVFYNGKGAYGYPADIRQMLDAPEALIKDYRLGSFHLVDLTQISDDDLRTITWSGLCLYAMKHAYDRDIVPVLRTIITSLEAFDQIFESKEFMSRQMPLICYIMTTYRSLDREEFMQSLQQSKSEGLKSAGLTVAEQLKEQGYLAGTEAIAKNMLKSGFSFTQVSELTNLPLHQVKHLVEAVTEE